MVARDEAADARVLSHPKKGSRRDATYGRTAPHSPQVFRHPVVSACIIVATRGSGNGDLLTPMNRSRRVRCHRTNPSSTVTLCALTDRSRAHGVRRRMPSAKRQTAARQATARRMLGIRCLRFRLGV